MRSDVAHGPASAVVMVVLEDGLEYLMSGEAVGLMEVRLSVLEAQLATEPSVQSVMVGQALLSEEGGLEPGEGLARAAAGVAVEGGTAALVQLA